MDLSDLIIFRTVAETGGIVKAAARLHRVQSNVTTRIKQLEASLGAPLFVRERQRLHLSAQGRTLLEYADRLLRLADEAKGAVVAVRPHGTLRLGSLESTAASRLPMVLSAFHRECPDVRVELATGTNDFLLAAVADRRLDAAFTARPPVNPALAHLPLFRERLVLIAARGQPPIRRAADIAGKSVIAFPHGCAYRRVVEQWLGPRTLASVRVMELSSYHAIIACVASGTGIAIVPESVLDTVRCDEVERYPVPKVLAELTTPLVWRAGDEPPMVSALRAVAQRCARSAPGEVKKRKKKGLTTETTESTEGILAK